MSSSEDPVPFRTYQSLKRMSGSRTFLPPTLKPGATLRLGLLSNPLSGGNRKDLHLIRKVLATRPQICHLEVSTPGEVGSALAELARKQVEVVAVNGGDGTIHAALTELFRRPLRGPIPVLALLRAGTASMIARDVGLPGSPEEALRRLLTWMSTGSGSATLVQRPILKVEMAPDQEPLYGMFFGAAGICRGIRFCLERVHPTGMSGQLAAGVTLGRFLLAAARGDKNLLAPVPATVALDKEPAEERDYLLILISTLERLFLGLRPYWSDETAPLYYTALGARPRHLLRALPSVLRGKQGRFNTPEHGYFSRKTREARLALAGGFTLDGELYTLDVPTMEITVTEGGNACFLKI
jgi:diacylglycerol kinase (ATP)